MCSLMSNYCCLLCPCQARKKMTILILGLDNAGKTTLVKGLQKESTCDIAPTVGFSRADLHIDRFDVTMFDLGGSPNIRAIWQNYYADAHGAVFVVDSSDQSRIAEARDAVTGILMHPQIAGKPVLVLANKQDNERALCEADIIEHLSLEQLVNKNKCLCKIEKCSAVQMKGPKGEYCGLTSLRWLLAAINGDHAKLHQRVLQDSAEQKQHQEAERKERYERVRLARLQREQVKGAEDLQHASFEQEEKDTTNPFQPIKTVLTKNKARMLRQQQESVSTQTQQTKGENGGPSENNADEITEPNNQRIQQMPSPGKRFSGESHEGVDAETQKSKKSKRKTRKIKLNRVEPLDADGVN